MRTLLSSTLLVLSLSLSAASLWAASHLDLGYALLEGYTGQGYALEAARAVLGYARATLELGNLCAIVAPGNARSTALLHKLDFRANGTVRLPGKDETLLLYLNKPATA